MIIVWLSVLGASIITALLLALLLIVSAPKRPALGATARWAARLWAFNVVLCLALLYLDMPAMNGPYWGGQWLLWPLLFSGLFALGGGSVARIRRSLDTLTEQINTDAPLTFAGLRWRKKTDRDVKQRLARRRSPAMSGRAGVVAIALALCVAGLVNGAIAVATTWTGGDKTALASLATITPQPMSATLPATDTQHLAIVTRGVAAYLGAQAISASSQNLSSLYHTEQREYTLQAVKEHLYWIAPLVYNNVWSNLGAWESPGYAVVDAESPTTPVVLRTQYHLRYMPDSVFNRNLQRHVYLSGYTGGDLVDPSFQVDDSWNPYYTFDLMRPTRGFTGSVVDKMLLVDPQTGNVTTYTPAATPAWVDRTLPASAVERYVTWWGKYARTPGFDANGSNPQAPNYPTNEGPDLVYYSLNQPMWLLPMSSADSGGTTTGVVLFDTRAMTGRYYAIPGLGMSDDVKKLIEQSPANDSGYTADAVALYQINGEPTWVSTMVQHNDTGATFQAVAMVDALHQRGENVIMQPTKAQALASYAQWLSVHNVGPQNPGPTVNTVTLQGRVARISTATENGLSVYYILLNGQTRIFKARLQISAVLPVVQPGDLVKLTFLETGQGTVTVTSFTDLSVQVTTPTPSPSPATATPASATPSPTR